MSPTSLTSWPEFPTEEFPAEQISPTCRVMALPGQIMTMRNASMAPTIPKGSNVYIEEIHAHDWARVQNRVVVVEYAAGQCICGRVLDNELSTHNRLLLHFDGKQRPRQQFIPAEDIAALWVAVELILKPEKVR